MAFNRCLCFVSAYWNQVIFDMKNLIFLIIFAISISSIATFKSIETSEIERNYYNLVGFIDINKITGYKTLIARIFYIFPLGSTIFYIVLFIKLRQKSKLVMMSTRKVEQKVFAQLLVTAILYGLMSIFF
ncbi:unnamed protein product [Caenorhabditis angaria]|uniref:Uncharacterized protein n=1 Tax=Caenorhabditis angaria TaxID=860376 RepID=A0A9P1I9P5_9PELO|nr:unnamed protein product [Caenorhabditis angaria]